MKKIVVALFFLLPLFVAAASAQITIGGQSFSMLVIMPLILMVVFMLIFGIVIFFDRYREKKEKGALEEKKEKPKVGVMEKVKEKIQRIGERREEKEGPRKEEEKKETEEYRSLADYLDEISYLKKNFKKMNAEEAFKHLGNLIKNFFSDYLGLDYEITFDELENELRAKKKEVVFFSKNLSEMSYNADKLSKKMVAMLLEEFEDVAKKIILKEEEAAGIEKRKKEVFARKEEREEPRRLGIREQKEKEEEKKAEYRTEEKKNKIIELIKKGRMYIKRDINMANNIYEEIYILYHQLPSDKKRLIHKEIKDFYNAIRLELRS